jgi:pimeloyl-ACP methyl ester carboxylesterase
LIDLSGRGEGALAALDFGPTERPYDLIFLHANGFNALAYRRILAPLAADFRILALDQRGHGASTLANVTEGRIDWSDFSDDLVALLHAEEVNEAVLSGHSMGGATVLTAAARAPGRAGRLVLFDPVIMSRERLSPAVQAGPHSGLIEGARRRRAEFSSRDAALKAYLGRGGFRSWPDDMVADYVEGGFRDLPGGGVRLACEPAWEASTFEAQANDPWSAFAAVACPVEILKAERDSTCRTDADEAALVASGRVRIDTIVGTSHFLPMERPELATQTLRRALLD